MSFLFEIAGPALWQATWQASLLAATVAIVLWFLGERAAPRWRYLLWMIVLIRFLLPVTPAAPWSVFHLVSELGRGEARERVPEAPAKPVPETSSKPQTVIAPSEEFDDPRTIQSAEIVSAAPRHDALTINNSHPTQPSRIDVANSVTAQPETNREPVMAAFPWRMILLRVWLAGFVIFSGRLIYAAILLRRRLSGCQPVADAELLIALQTACGRIGVRRTPRLMISPDLMSPCVVGCWRPRIVLPEASLTELAPAQLEQVFAHELGHLKRGDLWTNWLLLAARTLHWFNPIAWWTVRRLQEEREAACDEIALANVSPSERNHYASTVLELATSLSPNPMVPGMIGFFAPKRSLSRRVRRIARVPRVRPLRPVVMFALCAVLAAGGLTDAGSPSRDKQESPGQAKAEPSDNKSTKPTDDANAIPTAFRGGETLDGRVIDRHSQEPLSDVRVDLLALRGRARDWEKVATTTSDENGDWSFENIKPRFWYKGPDRLIYQVVARAEGRPRASAFAPFVSRRVQGQITIPMSREGGPLSGHVVDEAGEPVRGARVAFFATGFVTSTIDAYDTTTNAEGRFTIPDIPVMPPEVSHLSFIVQHPDYVLAQVQAPNVPADVTVTLKRGCTLTGTAVDDVTGQPAAGVTITAVNVESRQDYQTRTNSSGEYTITVPQGNYDILAWGSDLVAVTIQGRECPRGKTIRLPDFQMIVGGMISGRLIDAETGESVSHALGGNPHAVDLKGPSTTSSAFLGIVKVDENGRFQIRAAPGENYPFVRTSNDAERTPWNIDEQEPVIVKSGEVTKIVITITPEKTDAEKMAAARQLLKSLPEDQTERVAAILEEFRKLKETVDHTAVWCSLMRELVSIGSDAVPQIIKELDKATVDRHIRRLAFAVRAIGDARAVPALIRAIPRTLVPASSDYGLIVADKELTEFMQKYDLSGRDGRHFSFLRPPREVFGTLRKLTGRGMTDERVPSLSLGDGPRRNAMMQKIYNAEAKRWADWWNAKSEKFVDDSDYQTVTLDINGSPIPPAKQLTPKAVVGDGGVRGQVLSPANESGKYVDHFIDLDTGLTPKWPDEISKDMNVPEKPELAQWAAEHGVDLMCVTAPDEEGYPIYALYGFDLKAWEITQADVQNLQKRIEAGTLKDGRQMSGVLIHVDEATNRPQPRKHIAFFYITREGNMGVIEITDHITIAKDITGTPSGMAPSGVGFHKGVKFNHKIIVP